MNTQDPERADISFSWKSFLYLKTHFYLRISCWTFSISSICSMSYPYRRDPLGIVKHTICFSVKSSSRKSFNYGSIPLSRLNVWHELRYNFQTWPSYCLCSVDSFAFGGTFKKGTSVFSSVFFEGQRCHWAQSLICVFQSIPEQFPKGFSLSEGLSKRRGKLGERNVPSLPALQPSAQNISRTEIRKGPVSMCWGPQRWFPSVRSCSFHLEPPGTWF